MSAPGALAGRGAVVTGGGRGIGAVTARRLAEAGASVVVAARSSEEIGGTARAIERGGGRAWAEACDVRDEASVARLGDAARARLGGDPDILVCAAGIAESAPFRKITAEAWDRLMVVNARGSFLCAREFAPPMAARGWGRVLFVASIAGLAGGRYIAHYAASKHAVVGLMRSLAVELAGSAVTVNALCPAYVDTPMTGRTLAQVAARTGLPPEAALAAVLATTGQERLVTPEEVAEEAFRLCLEEAAGITGQALRIGVGVNVP